jgi:hypothetical protein
MSQEFIKELERLKAKQAEQGGFNAPAPVAPGMQPQAPQELSAPQVGPTLASEVQPDPMASTLDVQAPSIQPETPLFQSAEPTQSPVSAVIPRGGVRTRGTGGQKPAMAAARTGGIAESDTELGFLETLRTVVNPSDEQVAANLAAGARTGGVQVLPEKPSVAANPMGVTPEVMATPESIADLSVNGTDVVTPQAITEAAPKAQIPGTIQNSNVQDLMGFKPKYEGQSLTDFMAGRDDPSAASVQVQDPQGRFRRQAAPVAGETPEQNQARTDSLFPEQAAFEQASADREARQAARPDFGEAQTRAAGTVTDRERRAARGDGISDADRRDIAKAQSPNASESERARGMKVAEKAGLDWRTGQPLKQDKETGGLTDYQAITAQQRQTEIDMKIAEGMEAKEAKREVEYEESRSNVRSTQDSFDKLRPVAEEIALLSGGKFTEGVLGWTASKLPFSTDAAQIERLTTEFEGSAFLQGLIDAKAKGATFGALSEREGDRILGQWGKITSPKSTNEQRIRAVNSMLESIQRSSERATSDHKEKFPELSSRSVEPKSQGSTKGKRYADDQDYGAKVDTYYKG